MKLELRQRSINNHSMDGYCEKKTQSLRCIIFKEKISVSFLVHGRCLKMIDRQCSVDVDGRKNVSLPIHCFPSFDLLD